jgi:pimeloyl-ACP methyl ester carboxylesterase
MKEKGKPLGHVVSRDGTTIGYEQSGVGAAVILVSGMLDYLANTQLATLLAPHFTVFRYDRRGHGKSGDTAPWSLEREVEDLAAVIEAAGGSACVFGSSGNGIFVLEASHKLLDRITKLAVWEPPYIVDTSRPPLPVDYQTQLAALLAQERRGDMVELFMTKAVGMPAEFVTPMRGQPFWNAFEAAAHTLCYDAAITGNFALPVERMATLTLPTLVMDGGTTPWLHHGAQALMEALPNAQLRTLDGQPHNADPTVLVPVLLEFFAG